MSETEVSEAEASDDSAAAEPDVAESIEEAEAAAEAEAMGEGASGDVAAIEEAPEVTPSPVAEAELAGAYANEQLAASFAAETFELAITNGATVAGKFEFDGTRLRLSGVEGEAAAIFPMTCRVDLEAQKMTLSAYQGSCAVLNGQALERQ